MTDTPETLAERLAWQSIEYLPDDIDFILGYENGEAYMMRAAQNEFGETEWVSPFENRDGWVRFHSPSHFQIIPNELPKTPPNADLITRDEALRMVAAEREACAQTCEVIRVGHRDHAVKYHPADDEYRRAGECAGVAKACCEAIRARGERGQ